MRRQHRNLGLASVLAVVTGIWLALGAPVQAAPSLTWNNTTGAWDVGVTSNWLPGPTTFANGDSVTFGTPTTDRTVTVAGGGVSPSLMTVNHSAWRYIFAGGTITSAGGIAVTGRGITQFNAGSVMGPTGSVTVGPSSSVDLNFTGFGGSSSTLDLARINPASSGTLVLAIGGTNFPSIDLTGYNPALRLGSSWFVARDGRPDMFTYANITGTITPQGDTYRFGGGGGGLSVASALADSGGARAVELNAGTVATRLSGSTPSSSMLVLTAANGYSGNTTVANGILRLAGSSGTALNSNLFEVRAGGALGLDPGMRNTGFSSGNEANVPQGNSNNRIADSATVRLSGGNLLFFGNGNTGTAETIGTLDIAAGHSVIDARYNNAVVYDTDSGTASQFYGGNSGFGGTAVNSLNLNGTNAAVLTIGALTRGTANGQLAVRGQNLGAVGATSASRIIFSTAPTALMIGGGGAAGSANISIIPFMWYSGADIGGNSFVTHDANGLRGLTAGEFVSTIAAAASTDNVRITASATVSGAKTINALSIEDAGAGVTVSGTGPLTVTSGVVMMQTQGTPENSLTISAPLDFAGNEGNIYTTSFKFGGSGRSINSVISNTGGKGVSFTNIPYAVYSGPASIGGANIYTGPTTINRGLWQTTASEVIPNGSDLRIRADATLTIGSGLTETVNSLAGAGTLAFGNGTAKMVVGSGTATNQTVVVGGGAGPGTVTPGDSPGTLTIGSSTQNVNLVAGSNAIFNFELGLPGIVGMGVNDLIAVNGNLTLDGTLNVTALPGFGPALGQGTGTYTLFTYSGTLTNNILNIGIAPPDYGYVVQAGGGLVTLTVPEPVSGLLFALAALGLARRRERG